MNEFDAFARYYDADYGAFDDDLPFYRELARRTGGPIIELMCGTGRLLRPLARAGYQITGVDISPALLERARERLTQDNLAERVTLAQTDVRVAVPPGRFALAIIALNSFMHLANAAEQLATLQHIHAALGPNGLLALDIFNPDPREIARHNGELALDKTFQLADGTRVQKFVVQSTDAALQRNHVTFIYDEIAADGGVRRATLPFTMRWLYRYEAEHLLARAGFELVAVYGSYDLDEYDSASEAMLVVAQKTA